MYLSKSRTHPARFTPPAGHPSGGGEGGGELPSWEAGAEPAEVGRGGHGAIIQPLSRKVQ
jgi:hypothetical protein